MAQSKQVIQGLLASAGTAPRHRFGQNFMIDQNLVRLVADAGRIEPGHTVIEVGPGTGTLTDELLSRGATVLAVEIDRDLAGLLRERYAAEPRFSLVEGDALASKHALHPAVHAAAVAGGRLVANLPYNIASPLVIELLIAGSPTLAFTVQKEVADRLKAPADSDAYGPLSVMAQTLGRVEVLRTLPSQAFWPAPKIESALVRIDRGEAMADAGAFGTFVAGVFGARRKTLRRGLEQAGVEAARASEVLARLGIEPTVRVETLAPGRILELFRGLADKVGV